MSLLANLPNPACCKTDNVNHLCPKCKAAYTGNSFTANAAIGAEEQADIDAMTPPNVMNFGDNRNDSFVVENQSTDDDVRDMSPPTLDYAKVSRSSGLWSD